MKSILKHNVAVQSLVLYLLFVVPVILIWAGFEQLVYLRLDEDVKSSDLALARAIAQGTNATMARSLQTVEQIAKVSAVVETDQASMEQLFQNVMIARPDINLVYRLDSDGVMVYHYPDGPSSSVGVDFSFRDYFQEANGSSLPFFSRGRISPTTDEPVTTAVKPIWGIDGEFLGIVATNITLQSLSDTLISIAKAQPPEEDIEIFIIDTDGRVIAHPDSRLLLTDLNSILPTITTAVLNRETGNTFTSDDSGQERLYTFAPIAASNWGVIVSRETSTAFSTIRAIRQGILITIFIYIIVGLIFWLALSQRVLKPIERLAEISGTIGKERGTSAKNQDELNELSQRQDQIGELATSLQRMEVSITARFQELSTLLQTSAAVVSSLETETVLNTILEQVEELLGVEKCAIVALDERQSQFRARASRGLSEAYTEHFIIDPAEPDSLTLRAINNNKPQQISDTESGHRYTLNRERSRSEGYRSILAVPLITQHAPPSALLVYRPDPHHFSDQEIELTCSFANQAAMAFENAALYSMSDAQLRGQTRRLEALIQSLEDGLILEDLDGRILYANRSISELIGVPIQDIVNTPFNQFIERLVSVSVEPNGEKRDQIRNQLMQALDGKGPREVEFTISLPAQTRYLQMRVFDVTDVHGNLIGHGQLLNDYTQIHELDMMKSSLISTVSHELRTPLAAIKGYVTTLLAEDVEWDPHSQREFLDIISHETDHLTTLVSELLDMSRLESGTVSMNYSKTDLYDLISNASKRAHPKPHLPLEIDIPAELPVLFVDAKKIEAVLRNLFENATKYAGDEALIQLSAEVQNRSVIIRVRDQGPGIPLEDSERVFESYYQLENGLPIQASGSGLGLAICRGFVKAHGGEIWLEPVATGTCIAFSLPLEPIELSAA
ncbi:MAG: GAF domain-containing protein [Anaerolineales bacterium]|nr:GAF domain-containing protein [Anaerolineales bacterium]